MVYSQEFLDKTIKHWQPRSKKLLTLEDAREITNSMVDLVIYLNELDKKYGQKRRAECGKENHKSIGYYC